MRPARPGDRRGYAGFGAELGEGVLGQPQLVTADDGRIVHQIEAGEDAPAVDAYLHLASAWKPSARQAAQSRCR